MTRDEFLDNVNDFYDLVDFCNENSLSTCDYLLSDGSFDDWVDEQLEQWARYDRWWEVKDKLNDLPSGYDWYDTEWSVEGLSSSDFDDWKEKVLEEADLVNVWDDAEPEDPEIYLDVDDKVNKDEIIGLVMGVSA